MTDIPRLVCTGRCYCEELEGTMIYVRVADEHMIKNSTAHLPIPRLNDFGPSQFPSKYTPFFERPNPAIIGLDDTSQYWMAFEDEAEAAIFKLTHL